MQSLLAAAAHRDYLAARREATRLRREQAKANRPTVAYSIKVMVKINFSPAPRALFIDFFATKAKPHSREFDSDLRQAVASHYRREQLHQVRGYSGEALTRFDIVSYETFEPTVRELERQLGDEAPRDATPEEQAAEFRAFQFASSQEINDIGDISELYGFSSSIYFPNVTTDVDFRESIGSEVCGLRAISQTLGINCIEALTILGRAVRESDYTRVGITPTEMAKVFASRNEALYVCEFDGKPISKDMLNQELPGRDRVPTVLIFGMGHWFIPLPSVAKKILASRLFPTTVMDDEDVTRDPPAVKVQDASAYESRFVLVVAATPLEAHNLLQKHTADSAAIVRETTALHKKAKSLRRAITMASRKGKSVSEQQKELTSCVAEISARGVPPRLHVTIAPTRATSDPWLLSRARLLAEELAIAGPEGKTEAKVAELANVRAKLAAQPVEIKDLNDVWANLLTQHGVAYTDIKRQGSAITSINASTGAKLIPFEDYAALEATFAHMFHGSSYDGQTLAGIASFLRKGIEGNAPLAPSSPNPFVLEAIGTWGRTGTRYRSREWIATSPPSHHDVVPEFDLVTGRVAYGLDFYRHYATIAREGLFPFVDMRAELLPLTLEQVLALESGTVNPHFMYVVSPSEAAAIWVGHGLMVAELVDAGLKAGKIATSDIVGAMRISTNPRNDAIIREFVDTVYAADIPDAHRKQLCNNFIGQFVAMGRDRVNVTKLAQSAMEASYYYNTLDVPVAGRGITIMPCRGVDGKSVKVHVVRGVDTVTCRTTHNLINMAIVQRGKAKLLALVCEIEAKLPGAKVLYANTDGLTYTVPKGGAHMWIRNGKPVFGGPKPPPQATDYSPKFGDLRTENPYSKVGGCSLKCDSAHPSPHTLVQYEPLDIPRGWSEVPFTGTPGDANTFNEDTITALGTRVHITGKPGTGKSHLISRLREKLAAKGRRVEVLAPTHAAARLIKGKTVHSGLSISTKKDKAIARKINKVAREYDAIIIDEVSMLGKSTYRALCQLPDSIAVYLVGDFRQLPPVADECRNYEPTQVMRAICGYRRLVLTHQFRSDAEYVDAVTAACEKGPPTREDIAMIDGIETVTALDDSDVEWIDRAIFRHNIPRRAWNRKFALIKSEGAPREQLIDRHVVAGSGMLAPRDKNVQVTTRVELPNVNALATLARKSPALFKDGLGAVFRYLSRARKVDGVWTVSVEYTTRAAQRQYVAGGVGAQAFPAHVRGLVFGDTYADVDIVNCQAVMMRSLAIECQLPGVVKFLTYYIDNREETLCDVATLMRCDRLAAKEAVIMSMNGGKGASFARERDIPNIVAMRRADYFLGRLEKASLELAKALAVTYPESFAQTVTKLNERDAIAIAPAHSDTEQLFSFLATMVFARERSALDIIVADGNRNTILMFDGAAFPKNAVPDLQGLERQLFAALGAEVKLAIKPMHTGEVVEAVPSDDVFAKEFRVVAFEGLTAEEFKAYAHEDDFDEFPVIFPGMLVTCALTTRGANSRDVLHAVNEEYRVVEYAPGSPIVTFVRELNGERVALAVNDFKQLMRPAYCITQYKVQGRTLENYAIFQLYDARVDKEGAYVALTRKSTTGRILVVDKQHGAEWEHVNEEDSDDDD